MLVFCHVRIDSQIKSSSPIVGRQNTRTRPNHVDGLDRPQILCLPPIGRAHQNPSSHRLLNTSCSHKNNIGMTVSSCRERCRESRVIVDCLIVQVPSSLWMLGPQTVTAKMALFFRGVSSAFGHPARRYRRGTRAKLEPGPPRDDARSLPQGYVPQHTTPSAAQQRPGR